MKLVILFAVVTTVLGQYNPDSSNIFPWWHTDDNDEYSQRSNQQSYAQCLEYGEKSSILKPTELQKQYEKAIYDEEKNLDYEYSQNQQKKFDGPMDYDAHKSYSGHGYRTSASALTTITGNIMEILRCDPSGSDIKRLDELLGQFKLSSKVCNVDDHINCHGNTQYRTITGVCNNLRHPTWGSSQTAFGRILYADYDDNISKPRRKSRAGGYLPPCRQITLALGTKPNFDRSFNNLFTIFGQYIGHDMSLSTPVSDKYLTPVSTCTCDSKKYWNKCTVIDILPDDPYLSGQKCMAFPATAQAFKDQYCSLGRKEQMNGNTHFIDLSGIYGSTERTAAALRSVNGKLKSTRRSWSKYEFPPAQREGLSCVDGTPTKPCLAGGDSRLMENLLFTGIQAMFLRMHNIIAEKLQAFRPHWHAMKVYEVVRQFNIEIFQTIVFGYWIPKLLGPLYGDELLIKLTEFPYDNRIKPVVFNEAATAAFRCHTLVRDLFSRCTPDGKRIDELWLDDISHKVKYAYDAENNGLDAFLCGALYDYGFAHDKNFAHQIRDRLFETTDNYGHYWRNDLAAINICRGREHGIRSYNDYRVKCKYPRAYYFRDFGDAINYDGIKLLEKIYKVPDDVDLFVGLTLEDSVAGGIVGPVSACLLAEQFRVLSQGDRFSATRKYLFKPDELIQTGVIALNFLICNTVFIEQIPLFAFSPPSEYGIPLINCTLFKESFDHKFLDFVIIESEEMDVRKAFHKFTPHISPVDIRKFVHKGL